MVSENFALWTNYFVGFRKYTFFYYNMKASLSKNYSIISILKVIFTICFVHATNHFVE